MLVECVERDTCEPNKGSPACACSIEGGNWVRVTGISLEQCATTRNFPLDENDDRKVASTFAKVLFHELLHVADSPKAPEFKHTMKQLACEKSCYGMVTLGVLAKVFNQDIDTLEKKQKAFESIDIKLCK